MLPGEQYEQNLWLCNSAQHNSQNEERECTKGDLNLGRIYFVRWCEAKVTKNNPVLSGVERDILAILLNARRLHERTTVDVRNATVWLSLNSLQPIDRPVQPVEGGYYVAVGQVMTAGETQGTVQHGILSAGRVDTPMNSGKWSARLRLCG